MAVANASVTLAERVGPLLTGTARADEVLAFCACLRRRGIASFLISGSPDALARDLACSGHAFRQALPRLSADSQATSEFVPFFDALAVADVDCARAIAAAARPTWNPSEELEEDFLAMSLFMSLLRLGTADAQQELRAQAKRYQDLAAGSEEDESKSGIIQAIMTGDGDAFDGALAKRMRQVRDRYRRLAANLSLDEEEAATAGSVSVEGLACVRLARLRGMSTQTDYLLVPSLALRASPVGDAEAGWRTPND